MSRDRYNILLFGSYANRPAIGELEQYYIVTGTGTNKGRAYEGNGTGWDEIALPLIPWVNITGAPATYAATDHALDPDSGPHTGKLKWANIEDPPATYAPTPSALTHGVVWAHTDELIVRDNAIGPVILPHNAKVIDIRIHVETAPSADITFDINKNGVLLETVTLTSGATAKTSTASADTLMSLGDVLSVDINGTAAGATGGATDPTILLRYLER